MVESENFDCDLFCSDVAVCYNSGVDIVNGPAYRIFVWIV